MPIANSNVVASTDVLQGMIEKVRNKLEDLFEMTSSVYAKIGKNVEVEVISEKLWRIPLKLYNGGTFQYYDGNYGVMGSGSGPKIDKLTAGFFYTNMDYTFSDQTIDTTSSPGQSVVNVFQTALKNAMEEVQVMADISLHNDGTGLLTGAASAQTVWNTTWQTYTFGTAGDYPNSTGTAAYVGIDRLREGMAVEVWAGKSESDNPFQVTSATGSGTGKRVTRPGGGTVAGPLIINQIDYANKKVYLNGVVESAATGDYLAFPQNALTATGSQLQTMSQNWPLTTDTARHGIYYANSTVISANPYYLGVDRNSTITQLQPEVVDAGGNTFNFNYVQVLLDRLTRRRSPDVMQGAIGIAPFAQRAAILNSGIAISSWFRSQSDKMIDIMPNNNSYTDTFTMCGLDFMISKRQIRNRVDIVNPSAWTRAQLFDTKFYEKGGRTIFEARDATTGGLRAGQFFKIVQAFDWACVDPGRQGVIQNLAVNTMYA